jgi:hypothetical protein
MHAVAQDNYIYMRGLFELSDIVNVYRSQLQVTGPIDQNSGETGPITAATGPTADRMPIWSRSSGMVKSEKFTMLSYSNARLYPNRTDGTIVERWTAGSCGLTSL